MITPDTLFALMLLLASLLATLVLQRAPPVTRMFGYLAAVLFAVFSLTQVLPGTLGEAAIGVATLVTLSTAPGALTLAVFSRLAGRVAGGTALAMLAVGAAVGFCAGYFGYREWAMVVLLANVIALGVLGLLHLRSNRREAVLVLASALALAAGGMSFAIAGPRDFALFAAAALMGIAVAVTPRSRAGVKNQTWRSRALSIRRKG